VRILCLHQPLKSALLLPQAMRLSLPDRPAMDFAQPFEPTLVGFMEK
jgi:hypothetical protein